MSTKLFNPIIYDKVYFTMKCIDILINYSENVFHDLWFYIYYWLYNIGI